MIFALHVRDFPTWRDFGQAREQLLQKREPEVFVLFVCFVLCVLFLFFGGEGAGGVSFVYIVYIYIDNNLWYRVVSVICNSCTYTLD